jgi:hypothetical protein
VQTLALVVCVGRQRQRGVIDFGRLVQLAQMRIGVAEIVVDAGNLGSSCASW